MNFILTTAVTLFIVIDSFGGMTVFYTILSDQPPKKRSKIIVREMIIAFVFMMIFLFWGQPLLDLLGLETATLRLTSGVILFMISLGMIFPTKSVLHTSPDEEPFIVPLAIPLIAGPSSLILLMLLGNQHHDKLFQIAIATFIAWFLSSIVLLLSPFLIKFLGKKGSQALERLMGMLLVMISIQLFIDGIQSLQHQL